MASNRRTGSLVVMTCNDDGSDSTCGFASQIENVDLVQNTPYLFVVDGIGAQEVGTFTFSVARVPFPANPGALYVSSAIPIYTDGLSQV